MRSSIACTKCRRSKVRCVNQGVGSTCDACAKSGRTCEYPEAYDKTQPRRGDAPGDRDASPDRQQSDRPRKKLKSATSASTAPKDAVRDVIREGAKARAKDSPFVNEDFTVEDILDPQILDLSLWSELLEVFGQHFATDLPFLHRPTFNRQLRGANIRSPDVQPSQALLLAFLALTAPLHKSLPRLFRNRWPQRLFESELEMDEGEIIAHCCEKAAKKLIADKVDNPDLDTVQVQLMLAYHQWRSCEALRCFMTLGQAIRGAQGLGLGNEEEPSLTPDTRESKEDTEALATSQAIDKEVKRRTFWSCVILDKYLSCGKNRPQSLPASNINLQLPCSRQAFDFGEEVLTMKLGEENIDFERRLAEDRELKMGRRISNDRDVRIERRSDEDTLTHYIRALVLFGDLMSTWSCDGGRRKEKEAPWSEKSEFFQFEKRLAYLQHNLPKNLRLTASNTGVHVSKKETIRDYVLIHSLHALCSIALDREWLPFLPFSCDRPSGPLDENTYVLPANKSTYWIDSARRCFKVSRELIDLFYTCQEHRVLVETPLTAFAAYTVTVCVLYSYHFPQMDQEHYLSEDGDQENPNFKHKWDRNWSALCAIKERTKICENFCDTIYDLDECFVRERAIYQQNPYRANSALGFPAGSSGTELHLGRRSINEGGGGLSQYERYEPAHKDLWQNSQKRDKREPRKFSWEHRHDDNRRGSNASTGSLASCTSLKRKRIITGMKSEDGDAVEQMPIIERATSSFTAVNGLTTGLTRVEAENSNAIATNSVQYGQGQSNVRHNSDTDSTPPMSGYGGRGPQQVQQVSVAGAYSYPTHVESAQRETLSLNESSEREGARSLYGAARQRSPLVPRENCNFPIYPEEYLMLAGIVAGQRVPVR